MRPLIALRKPWPLLLPAILFVLALAPSLALLLRATDMPLLGRFKDDAIYFESARSLATGSGYRIPSLPGQPFQTKYPPLWPLILSSVWRINPNFPANLAVASVLAWGAVPAYLALAWAMFVRWGLRRAAAWFAVFVLACNSLVLLFGAMIMADLWFSTALLACVLCAERAAFADHGYRYALLAGVLAAVAFLTKSSGLPLLASLPICFLLRRQYRRAALSFAPVFAAVASWNLWVRAHVSHSSDLVSLYYTSYLGYYLRGLTWHNFLHVVSINTRLLFSSLRGLFLVGAGDSPFEVILCSVAIFAGVLGVAQFVKRTGCWQYPAFAAIYLVQLIVWNPILTSRLLFPLLPLLLAGIATQITDALVPASADGSGWRLNRTASIAIVGLLAPLFLLVGVASCGAVLRSVPNSLAQGRRETARNLGAYQWISAHTPATAAFVADDDGLLYLYTGRSAVRQIMPAVVLYTWQEDALENEVRALPAYARAFHFQYVMLTSTDLTVAGMERFRPLLKETMSRAPGFVCVYESGGTEIYRDDGAPLPAARRPARSAS